LTIGCTACHNLFRRHSAQSRKSSSVSSSSSRSRSISDSGIKPLPTSELLSPQLFDGDAAALILSSCTAAGQASDADRSQATGGRRREESLDAARAAGVNSPDSVIDREPSPEHVQMLRRQNVASFVRQSVSQLSAHCSVGRRLDNAEKQRLVGDTFGRSATSDCWVAAAAAAANTAFNRRHLDDCFSQTGNEKSKVI
jgi:hypothetical protein